MTTTLDIPQHLLDRVQGLAVARNTTLQALVTEGLQTVLEASVSSGAGDRSSSTGPSPSVASGALARLRAGVPLGGGKLLTREEAHAR